MKSVQRVLSLENPDHHLWNNNGTWFVHYTVYPTAVTKQRVRKSLGTRCLAEARRKRDELLETLHSCDTVAGSKGTESPRSTESQGILLEISWATCAPEFWECQPVAALELSSSSTNDGRQLRFAGMR